MQNIEFLEKEEKLDLRKIIGPYIRKWPWFLISMLLFGLAAYLNIRYAIPQYKSETTLKFDKKKSPGLSSALADLDNLGMGLGNADELKGEAAVLTSRPVLLQVVKNLNLNVQYYKIGEIKDSELFSQVPITGEIISLNDEKKFNHATYVIVEANADGFILLDGKKAKIKGTFNKPLILNFGTVMLKRKSGLTFSSEYTIVFSNPLNKVKSLENNIKVDLPDQKALLMTVSMVGSLPDKSEAVLNEVTKQYNLDGQRDKDLQSQNTQDFIDKRLEVITRDLSGVENQKEDFQTLNRIVDLQAQAQLALQNTSENTTILLQQQTQLDLLNSLAKEASKSDYGLMPSNLGLNPSLEQAISAYNTMLINRNKTLKQATNENPAVIEMTREIVSLKNIVRENIQQQKATVQSSIAQINGQIANNNGLINKVPGQSKVYRGIERQQTLKEQLFLYLLQKREENAINLSVNIPKAKIVNPAFTADVPVSPKKNIVYLGALFLGVLLPFAIFYIYFMLDDKIYSSADIKERSSLAVLSDIPSLDDSETHLVQQNDFSNLAEAFRVLVSNIKFVLPQKQTAKIIMVTSSVKGEGKTLVSVNLALTLGLKNKRTLLLGSDIRNPQIQRYDTAPVKRKGITEYLYDETINIKDLIHITDSNPHCDVIYAGSIPPNPQELLSNGRYQEMIEKLSAEYEYIVIDSAPLMLVSDTLNIADTADATLYVVRSGVSRNILIDFANSLVKESKIKNVSFVLNDVSRVLGGYGYGYNYGYGYGYSNDVKKKWWQKLKKKNKEV